MRFILIVAVALFFLFSRCTDSHSEKLIEGHWHAVKILEDTGKLEHVLPNGIHLNFDYPKYDFEGESKEDGNYYIKDEQLHLFSEELNQERQLTIMRMTPDSLTLQLVDSTGIKAVQFVRSEN